MLAPSFVSLLASPDAPASFAMPYLVLGIVAVIITAVLFLIVILFSIVPIISMVNKPVLVLGMPLIMLWSIGIVLAVVIVLRLALHWGVK